jgi:hypothetical protein
VYTEKKRVHKITKRKRKRKEDGTEGKVGKMRVHREEACTQFNEEEGEAGKHKKKGRRRK